MPSTTFAKAVRWDDSVWGLLCQVRSLSKHMANDDAKDPPLQAPTIDVSVVDLTVEIKRKTAW